MNEFKLLAVRALSGCHSRFAKNLTHGLIYPFYKNYQFLNADNNSINADDEVISIKTKPSSPQNLFDVKNLRVNVSAIAGKNGSGKSSLVELIYAIIYTFSVEQQLLETDLANDHTVNIIEDNIRDVKIELIELWDKKNEVYKSLKAQYGKDMPLDQFEKTLAITKEEADLNDRLKNLEKRKKNFPVRKQDLENFRQQLKAVLFFEIDKQSYAIKSDVEKGFKSTIWQIHNNGTPPTPIAFSDVKDNVLNFFFYTISVNYSHHSLNAKGMGEWINSLFHKNDGYRTPLVINPMRNSGNFDINREMSLVKYRLLCNLLFQKFHSPNKPLYVSETQTVEKIVFKLNRKKVADLKARLTSKEFSITGDTRSSKMITEIVSLYDDTLPMSKGLFNDVMLKDVVMKYIVGKIDRINELYPGFERGFEFGEEASQIENVDFLRSLILDGTHITYKLMQALNFLRFITINGWGDLKSNYLSSYSDQDEQIIMEFEPDKLIRWMEIESADEIFQKIPPSIFDIEFVLTNQKTKEESSFADLSSGQQHLIYVIQSVIYHINNLQSAHLSHHPRPIYSAVNIIYDEIELYFHPEFQRRLISDLLAALGNLYFSGNKTITAVNVQLLTHSPFLLSDIPSDNILLLDLNKSTGKTTITKNHKTFAANINDLLADSFFLKDTLMGRFAETQVNNLLTKIKKKEAMSADDKLLIKSIGDDYLRISIQEYIKSKKSND